MRIPIGRGEHVISPDELQIMLRITETGNIEYSNNEGLNWSAAGKVKTVNNTEPDVNGNVAVDLSGKANLVEGRVPASELPSYVDDVLEFDEYLEFPVEGEVGKIYVALDTGFVYRWSGTIYARLAEGVVLGETSQTAHRGDHGKTAYDHVGTTNNPHSVTAAQVGAVALEEGKTLSENDFTDTLKTKLDNIQENADVNPTFAAGAGLSVTSVNGVVTYTNTHAISYGTGNPPAGNDGDIFFKIV